VGFAGKMIDVSEQYQRVAPMAAGRLVLSNPLPSVPASSTRKTGTLVKVLIEVDEKGVVTNVLATDGPADLTAAASSAVQGWTFRPYMVAGKAQPMVTNMPLLFLPANAGQPAKVLFVPQLVRISGGVLASQNTHKVLPPRPSMEFSGTVILQVLVDPQGQVAAVGAISGPQALRASCEDAVAQWRYQPYLLNGQPTWVESTAVMKFTWGQPQ
jgi:TonB family protein